MKCVYCEKEVEEGISFEEPFYCSEDCMLAANGAFEEFWQEKVED